MKTPLNLLAVILALCVGLVSARAQGTAFTYQGRLTDNGSAANGNYDLRFTIYDSVTSGTVIAGPITNSPTSLNNGLFNVTLDFGANVFDGSARWLEIAVQTNGGASFTTLTPRQPLTPTPYALFTPAAATATTASNVVNSAVAAPQLNTPGVPASGQVLSYNGASLVWTNAENVAAAWSLNGNAGTTPSVNFLGTTDNQPLEIRVNGRRALRLEPTSDALFHSNIVNVIAGAANNFVPDGVYGATISGGGAGSYSDSPSSNSITFDFGTVGGGLGNKCGGFFATIAGGQFNTCSGLHGATVGGGIDNTSTENFSTVGGGLGNTSSGLNATVAGGQANAATGSSATVGGGSLNASTGTLATVPGGGENEASGSYSFAAGFHAKAKHSGSFVWASASPVDFVSERINEFAVRATGGLRFVSGVDSNGVPVAGVTLPAGSGSWSSLSDRNAKENFKPADARGVLERVAALPIQTWNYKSQGAWVRHIGPVAQDFHSAFGVGEDDLHIATVDEGGVALAAIQGLNEKLEDRVRAKEAEIQQLKGKVAELDELRQRLAAIESLLKPPPLRNHERN